MRGYLWPSSLRIGLYTTVDHLWP